MLTPFAKSINFRNVRQQWIGLSESRVGLLQTAKTYQVGGASLTFCQGDITLSETDAIANAANRMLAGGGGVDGAIHRAAGPELRDALRKIKKGLPDGLLPTGQAVITPGFKLKSRFVIHCVGPVYAREADAAEGLLRGCYANALSLCEQYHLASIAFPSISTGAYGYPLVPAADTAVGAVAEQLRAGGSCQRCQFVLFDNSTLSAYLAAAQKCL